MEDNCSRRYSDVPEGSKAARGEFAPKILKEVGIVRNTVQKTIRGKPPKSFIIARSISRGP